MNESVALDKKFQSKFVKKVSKLKKRVKSSGGIPKNKKEDEVKRQRGVVYVGHLPPGFHDKEMMPYFRQFGKVSNVRVCRSKTTGQSKGYGFVEFANVEVAKIAAETMDNYLMFKRRLIAKYLPQGQTLRRRHKGYNWSTTNYPLKIRREEVTRARNRNISEAKHLQKSRALISSINKNLKKLQAVGINYCFQAIDDSNNLNQNIVQPNSINIQLKKEIKSDPDATQSVLVKNEKDMVKRRKPVIRK